MGEPSESAAWHAVRSEGDVDLQHAFSLGAHPDPRDGNASEFLNPQNVLLRSSWQLLPRCALRDVLGPTLQGFVLADDLLQILQVAGEVSDWQSHLRHLFVSVGNRDSDCLQTCQNIQLGDVEAAEAIDERRVLHQGQVQPATASTAAGGGAILVTSLLEMLTHLHLLTLLYLVGTGAVAVPLELHCGADVFLHIVLQCLVFVLELCWEGAVTDSCGVGLHNTDDGVDLLGGDPQPSADSSDSGVGGGDKGVRAEVDVQQCRIRALDQNLVTPRDVLVDEGHGVDDLRPQQLSELSVALNLLLDAANTSLLAAFRIEGMAGVVLSQGLSQHSLSLCVPFSGISEPLLGPSDKFAEPPLEGLEVQEVAETEAVSDGLRRVAGADAALGGSDGVRALLGL
mmetsp:Transcript_56431/g.123318  ORF Transcript_56431/g.123318 Transcript_56431/m.123318 type:complete len:398 (+) Transcript_56431:271-1464(+)